MIRFESTRERLRYLVDHHYYEYDVFSKYSPEFLDAFYAHADALPHRFETFLGAFKFYRSYALKTFDGEHYLEDFPQRAAAVSLALADGDEPMAMRTLDEIVLGRFQPATPTFLNLGKAQRGEPVSCFLVRIEDNMESISRGINAALQLSKRGGGVALLLSNLREEGAPIKHIENQSSGVVPVMKLLEDSFSYANQLGARQGAGAVYLARASPRHPEVPRHQARERGREDPHQIARARRGDPRHHVRVGEAPARRWHCSARTTWSACTACRSRMSMSLQNTRRCLQTTAFARPSSTRASSSPRSPRSNSNPATRTCCSKTRRMRRIRLTGASR